MWLNTFKQLQNIFAKKTLWRNHQLYNRVVFDFFFLFQTFILILLDKFNIGSFHYSSYVSPFFRNDLVYVDESNGLILPSIRLSDDGIYVCIATNEAGKNQKR